MASELRFASCAGALVLLGSAWTGCSQGPALVNTPEGGTTADACPALGCNPYCPDGVLKDVNGCDTCQCVPGDAGADAEEVGTDGGDCCPVGWSFYACTFPDGGAAHACHNPALGCASSLTCGEGCDPVVSWRCGV
jgi:hypothetical protein